jgi:hypothetical protein
VKKSPKRPVSPYAADVKTTPEVSGCDTQDMPDMLSVREHPVVYGLYGNENVPAHKGYLATVSNQKGKAAK